MIKTVLIIADMEGCTLIDSKYQVFTNSLEPAKFGREAMESDVNCVLKSMSELGVTKAFVADWHDTGKNLTKNNLYSKGIEVELVTEDIQDALDPISSKIEGVIFVGFHDKPGVDGVLSHCYSFIVDRLIINDKEVGETALNIYNLYERKISVIMVIGSYGATLEAKDINKKIRTVVTKQGYELIPRDKVYEHIKKELLKAIKNPATYINLHTPEMILCVEGRNYKLKGGSIKEKYSKLEEIVSNKIKSDHYSNGNTSILEDSNIR